MSSNSARDRVRSLTYDQKLRLLALAAAREREAREARVTSPDANGLVVRVPGPTPLLFFLSAEDLAL